MNSELSQLELNNDHVFSLQRNSHIDLHQKTLHPFVLYLNHQSFHEVEYYPLILNKHHHHLDNPIYNNFHLEYKSSQNVILYIQSADAPEDSNSVHQLYQENQNE